MRLTNFGKSHFLINVKIKLLSLEVRILFNFFKKLFIRKQKIRLHPQHFAKDSQSVAKRHSVKKIPASQTQPAKITTTRKTATILVKFINEDHMNLRQPLIFKASLGEPIRLKIPKFKNYIFKKIDGLTSNIVSPEQTITVCYQKELGQPVMIYCFDYDTHQLLSAPTFMTGPLNENYQVKIPSIIGYQIHLSIGNLTGSYNKESQNVVLYYRKSDWKLVQAVNYLVKIKFPAVVYSHASEKSSYDFKLPVDSVWKVFKEVHTTDTTWLSLGGAEWVKKDSVSRIASARKKLN